MHLNLKGKSHSLIFAEDETGGRDLIVFGAFFLALLLSLSLAIFLPSLRSTPDLTETTEQPVSLTTVAKHIGLVGPSGEEIHNFLYPMPVDVIVAPALE